MIIIRPHPADAGEELSRKLSGLDNVFIINEGNPEPWILASTLLLVTGCTTGLQAVMLNKPVVSYIPVARDHLNKSFLTNLICPLAYKEKDIEEYFFLAKKNSFQWFENYIKNKVELMNDHIASLSGRLASMKMVDALCSIDDKDSVERSLELKKGNLNLTYSPQNYKFPSIDIETVAKKVERLRELFKIDVDYDLSELRPRVYLIEKK